MIVVHKVTEYKIIKSGVQGPSGSVSIFPDTSPVVQDAIDNTKLLRFELNDLTTGTTRVITMADADVNLQDFLDHLSASTNIHGLGIGSDVVGTLDDQILYAKTIDTPIFQDATDNTKQVDWDLTAIATATSRTITMPNADIDLGDVGAAPAVFSLNRETLSANKTVTAGTDATVQQLNPNGATRTITVSDGTVAGQWFEFINDNSTNDSSALTINVTGKPSVGRLTSGQGMKLIWDGSTWNVYGTGLPTYSYYSLALGPNAVAKDFGAIAIGRNITANNDNDIVICGGGGAYTIGTGVKNVILSPNNTSITSSSGLNVAIGDSLVISGESNVGIGKFPNITGDNNIGLGESISIATDNSIAIGPFANASSSAPHGIALGTYSYTTRRSELARSIDNVVSSKVHALEEYWTGSTTNSTPAEIFLGGVASARCIVAANSVLKFKIDITARDNTSGDCAAYEFVGAIKRDGAGNTALVGSNVSKTVIAEDDTSWDVSVTADDTNDSLKITVTGDATNTVKWGAIAKCVEVKF